MVGRIHSVEKTTDYRKTYLTAASERYLRYTTSKQRNLTESSSSVGKTVEQILHEQNRTN